MARYKVKAPFLQKDCLPCAIKGVGVVDLLERGYDRIYPASILGPEKRVRIPGATQAQLKYLHECGSPLIEKVEAKVKVKEEDTDGER